MSKWKVTFDSWGPKKQAPLFVDAELCHFNDMEGTLKFWNGEDMVAAVDDFLSVEKVEDTHAGCSQVGD